MTFRRRRQAAVPESERTEARLAIARSQESQEEVLRLRRALDALPIGVVLADRGGRTLVENVAARTYQGHAAVLVDEAVERHLRRAVRGMASGQHVEFIGPPRTVLAVHAIPLGDGGEIGRASCRERV